MLGGRIMINSFYDQALDEVACVIEFKV